MPSTLSKVVMITIKKNGKLQLGVYFRNMNHEMNVNRLPLSKKTEIFDDLKDILVSNSFDIFCGILES